MLRDYKDTIKLRGGILISDGTTIQLDTPIELEFDSEFITLDLQDMTPEIQKKRFDRAKKKREVQQRIDEDLLDYFEEENEIK